APSNITIFFKDNTNEFKGPFTEREVQEWYRKGFFESFSQFNFMMDGNSPDDSTPAFALGELCTFNGIGAPFSLPYDIIPPEKRRALAEQRLHSIEEEIRSFRVKCDEVLLVKERIEKTEEKLTEQYLQEILSIGAKYDDVLRVKERIEKMEKKIKGSEEDFPNTEALEYLGALINITEFGSSLMPIVRSQEMRTPLTVEEVILAIRKKSDEVLREKERIEDRSINIEVLQSADVAAEKVQPQVEAVPGAVIAQAAKGHPNHKLPEWMTKCIEFFLFMLHVFDKRESLVKMLIPKEMYHEEMYHKMEMSIDKMGREEEQQLFAELVRAIEENKYIYCAFCDRCMFTAKHVFMHIAYSVHQEKMPEFDMFHTLLLKMVNLTRLERMFAEAREQLQSERRRTRVYLNRHGFDPSRLRPSRNLSCTMNNEPSTMRGYVMRALTGLNGEGENLMKALEDDIGNAKARCFPCKLIFANPADYYKHLLTFYHINVMADTSDMYTLLVNVMKRDEARAEKFPELPVNNLSSRTAFNID
ncbi:hypothetical protein PMAYCL1PPCAC_01653, partial [Pristionchus mayeri]